MGIAEANAITITTTANSLPLMSPRNCPDCRPRARILEKAFQAGANAPVLLLGKRQLVSLGLEGEVDRLGLAARDRHVMRLRAVIFMPRRHRVLPRRQVRQRERSVVLADLIVIRLES